MKIRSRVAAFAVAVAIAGGGSALFAAPALAEEAAPVAPIVTEVASSPDTQTESDSGSTALTSGLPDSHSEEAATTPSPESDTPPAEPVAEPSPVTASPETSVSDVASKTGSPSQSSSPKGHTPVVLCHKPGDPAQQTLTVDDNAVKGHLGHGDTLGECTPIVTPPAPTPVEGWWIMPNGGTADNVTWPQTATPAGIIPCGTTAQVDLYPSQAVLDALAADGTLTQGEDYSTVISWRFVTGEACPPEPGPANPAATVAVTCGSVFVTLMNDGENLLTASEVVYVDGVFKEAVAVPAGGTETRTYTFTEDTGEHTVDVRTGPAFGDVRLAYAEQVVSDCIPPADYSTIVDDHETTDCDAGFITHVVTEIPTTYVWDAETRTWDAHDGDAVTTSTTRPTTADDCPAVVVPPVTPPTDATPSSPAPAAAPAPAARVLLDTPVAVQLAQTGSVTDRLFLLGGIAISGALLGILLALAARRRQKTLDARDARLDAIEAGEINPLA